MVVPGRLVCGSCAITLASLIVYVTSDVSRTSTISVSSYLRTAAAVHSQEDMGNDLLMARVDLTPVLDGHVSSLACDHTVP